MIAFSGIFGIAAGILSFCAYLFYIVAIIKGTTKPNRATWFILALVGIITSVSYKFSGADNTIWVSVSHAIASSIIALLAIKYGVGGWEKTDMIAFAGAIISLVAWWYFSTPVIALVASLCIDFFGLLPTIKKSWHRPEQEDRLAWTTTQLSNALNFLALDSLAFAVVIYPLYYFVVDGVLLAFLYKPLFKKHA